MAEDPSFLRVRVADRGLSMTTLLIGANGQLGSELRQLFDEGDLVSLTHADLELTNPAQVRETLFKYRPDLILNTAAHHPPPGPFRVQLQYGLARAPTASPSGP